MALRTHLGGFYCRCHPRLKGFCRGSRAPHDIDVQSTWTFAVTLGAVNHLLQKVPTEFQKSLEIRAQMKNLEWAPAWCTRRDSARVPPLRGVQGA